MCNNTTENDSGNVHVDCCISFLVVYVHAILSYMQSHKNGCFSALCFAYTLHRCHQNNFHAKNDNCQITAVVTARSNITATLAKDFYPHQRMRTRSRPMVIYAKVEMNPPLKTPLSTNLFSKDDDDNTQR